MNEIADIFVDKLKEQEKIMANERGPFDLFALFLREDAPGKWDIVVSAEWIEKNKEESFKYIANSLQHGLTKDELLLLSRIALINESNPALEVIHKAINTEHINVLIENSNFFGLQIMKAYFITSRKHKSNDVTNRS